MRGGSPCGSIPAAILPLNLAQISSIYRLPGSFMAIQDGLQWFVNHWSYAFCIGIILTCVSDMHFECQKGR